VVAETLHAASFVVVVVVVVVAAAAAAALWVRVRLAVPYYRRPLGSYSLAASSAWPDSPNSFAKQILSGAAEQPQPLAYVAVGAFQQHQSATIQSLAKHYRQSLASSRLCLIESFAFFQNHYYGRQGSQKIRRLLLSQILPSSSGLAVG
jgi:hypothetical protein